MSVPVGRYLLVELAPDLDAAQTTLTGVWCGLKQIAGVSLIADLSAVTQETLDAILLRATIAPEDWPQTREERPEQTPLFAEVDWW